MRSIILNTDALETVLSGQQTVIRKLIKPSFKRVYGAACAAGKWNEAFGITIPPQITEWYAKNIASPSYQPGDVVYVQELWADVKDFENRTNFDIEFVDGLKYLYKRDNLGRKQNVIITCVKHWRPPTYMPEEAARLFLKILDVREERIQDMTEAQALETGSRPNLLKRNCSARGQFKECWNRVYSLPKPVSKDGIVTHFTSFPWKDIHEVREFNGLPWIVEGNPYVFAYEFERVEKPGTAVINKTA